MARIPTWPLSCCDRLCQDATLHSSISRPKESQPDVKQSSKQLWVQRAKEQEGNKALAKRDISLEETRREVGNCSHFLATPRTSGDQSMGGPCGNLLLRRQPLQFRPDENRSGGIHQIHVIRTFCGDAAASSCDDILDQARDDKGRILDLKLVEGRESCSQKSSAARRAERRLGTRTTTRIYESHPSRNRSGCAFLSRTAPPERRHLMHIIASGMESVSLRLIRQNTKNHEW